MTTSKKKPNHLIHEKSPYLQQHINNPVDWYPWGETAFTKAKQENKPIFLSIGYATCHWCHVMAHESFEDPEVAHLLNSSFICVKVDREERPDIDNIYMTICQLLTGSGGWPLTIIMTPTKKPFFAATYLPKETTYNIKGLLTLIPEIQNLWEHKTEDLKASAQEITNTLQKISQLSEKKHTITSTILDTTYSHLLNSFDEHYGGFGNAPKFPTPHQLLFLLRYWKRTKNIYSLKMVEITLEQMRKGGIYDHVGYGFHRYATDRKWIIPHFEKMLYDQALLIIAYTAAYQATKKPLYKKTVQELIDYVLREMTDSHHGFYSAEDADSEGQEGKFYTWQYQELKQILTPDEFKLATKIYNIEKEGNFNHHIKNQQSLNILYQTQTIPETVKYFNKTEHEIQKNIETLRRKLFHHRKTRMHPQKDDKILTDWNALMIVALSKASQIFTTKKYLIAAEKALQFINTTMLQKDGSLLHRYRHGEAKIDGYADDYAFLIWALLELYQATFKPVYLQQSLKLTSYLMNHFWDTTHGGLYFTSDTHEQLITRTKELYDGAIPSANSITLHNLIQLARITGNSAFENKAHQIITAFSDQITTTPQGYTQFMLGLEYMFGSAYELVIVGKHADKNTQTILQTIQSFYLPNKVLILKDPTIREEIENLAPFTQPFIQIQNKPTLYVCKNHHCELPTTKIQQIQYLLN